MSVAVALAISIYANGPLFSRLRLLIFEQAAEKAFFFFKQGFILSLREEENSVNSKKAG